VQFFASDFIPHAHNSDLIVEPIKYDIPPVVDSEGNVRRVSNKICERPICSSNLHTWFENFELFYHNDAFSAQEPVIQTDPFRLFAECSLPLYAMTLFCEDGSFFPKKA
jgi:hypothetical protein